MTATVNPFDWSGGHPALDFVNTLDERPFPTPIESQAPRENKRKHQQPGDAKPDASDIPRRQAGAKPEPGDDDPARPDAYGSEAASRTAQVLSDVARPGHYPSPFHNPYY